MGEQFEYLYQEYPLGVGVQAETERILNILGSMGWKMIGFAGADKTIGMNKALAVFIRDLEPLPEPTDRKPGWNPDPTGRHQHRWWDGTRWGTNVSDNGQTSEDPPTRTDMRHSLVGP